MSDEPRAALIGRDVLSAGGNAVDAVVAMYFALSVTYPAAATLGGEGVCVIQRSKREGVVEAIEFAPLLLRREGRTVAIPGPVRGMFALHARHGRLPWAQLLQPAEQLARFGNPVSRALARQLAAAPPGAFDRKAAQEVFTNAGRTLGEGAMMRQVQLASVLATIRIRGAGDFYNGDIARRIATGLSENAGVAVTLADVRDYRPRWIGTTSVKVGNHDLHMPAGAKAALFTSLWQRLADGGGAASVAANAPGGDTGESAGFAAIDSGSGVAACTVGANGGLDDVRMIGNTGIVQAGARDAGEQYPGLPLILVNAPRKDALGAVTGAGKGAAGLRAIRAAAQVFGGSAESPSAVVTVPPVPGVRTNVIFCPTGMDIDPDLCRFAVEPGAHGLAVGAGQ